MRVPNASQAQPSTAPASVPSALSERSVRLVTRGGTEACRSSMLQESTAPRIVVSTIAGTRPSRPASSSRPQNPTGAYSSTLLSISVRPARTQVSRGSACSMPGPCGSKRNGNSET